MQNDYGVQNYRLFGFSPLSRRVVMGPEVTVAMSLTVVPWLSVIPRLLLLLVPVLQFCKWIMWLLFRLGSYCKKKKLSIHSSIYPLFVALRLQNQTNKGNNIQTSLTLCCVLHPEAKTDLIEGGAEGGHTKPCGTVDIVRGESCFYTVSEAESLKGEAGDLLLSIDTHHCLAILVTPGRRTDGNVFCPTLHPTLLFCRKLWPKLETTYCFL